MGPHTETGPDETGDETGPGETGPGETGRDAVDPQSERPLNPTAASLLGFLHTSELTGYELVGVAEQSIGPFWSLTRSQVYRELAGLAERGLVVGGAVGPRSRRPYRLTPRGRAAFAAWIETSPADEAIRYPLLLTLSFGALVDPGVLATHLEEHRRIHERRLADYEAVPPELVDRFGRAVLSFGRHYEQAVLAWMAEVPGILGEREDHPVAGQRSGGAKSPAGTEAPAP